MHLLALDIEKLSVVVALVQPVSHHHQHVYVFVCLPLLAYCPVSGCLKASLPKVIIKKSAAPIELLSQISACRYAKMEGERGGGGEKETERERHTGGINVGV